ncbi:MAG: hypothetical protein JNK60_09690 [Acidobacteria bacterium]|nr:hypothetical protein [Acidobacteriota bacterium]
MNRGEYLHLLAERTALGQMIADIPEEDVLDRSSMVSRLKTIEEALAGATAVEREPANVRLTFKGRPVIGSYGIFAEFGMKAVNAFTESVAAMAASLTAPLAAMGPIPNREQYQLLITSTALGSFGFELEEHRPRPWAASESSGVAMALSRTQALLRGTQGTDDELADSAAEADRRAVDKVRGFLETLAENEAVCTVEVGDSVVRFTDVGQVRTSIVRLSQENLREETEHLRGEFQGVLPKSRAFEFRVADTSQVIKGKISPTIVDPDELNGILHESTVIKVMVTRVGSGRPRYLLLEAPPRRLNS